MTKRAVTKKVTKKKDGLRRSVSDGAPATKRDETPAQPLPPPGWHPELSDHPRWWWWDGERWWGAEEQQADPERPLETPAPVVDREELAKLWDAVEQIRTRVEEVAEEIAGHRERHSAGSSRGAPRRRLGR